MTPEGRRRKARKVLSSVVVASDNLDIAAIELEELCAEVGIRPAALVSLLEARRVASAATVQLRQLLGGFERAAANKPNH